MYLVSNLGLFNLVFKVSCIWSVIWAWLICYGEKIVAASVVVLSVRLSLSLFNLVFMVSCMKGSACYANL